MHLDTTPVIDRLIADRRRYVGYPRDDTVTALQERVERLEQELMESGCECCS